MSACDYGQFSTGTVCKMCDFSCSSCVGISTNCTRCLTIAGIINTYLYVINGSYSVCLTQCPSGNYNQISNVFSTTNISNMCVQCAGGCLTCTGPGTTNCQSCKDTSYLIINTTICNATCPLGQYIPLSGNLCTACPVNCAGCTSATVCTLCLQITGNIMVFLTTNNTC